MTVKKKKARPEVVYDRGKEDLVQSYMKMSFTSGTIPTEIDVTPRKKRSLQEKLAETPRLLSRSQKILHSPVKGKGIKMFKCGRGKTLNLVKLWEQRGVEAQRNLPIDGEAKQTKPENNHFLCESNRL